MKLSPIVLFTYNRLDTLKQTVDALSSNSLAMASDLIVYSDGSKSSTDEIIIVKVRTYLKTITGFKTITIHEAPTNMGLANSIIDGVTNVINQYGKVIVVEDDLVCSTNFLNYMNAALDFYSDQSKIFSITGHSIPINCSHTDSDVYFTSRSSSWGWATWQDRWSIIDWEVKDYTVFKKDKILRRNFNKMGSDMSQMLDRQMQGKINSWAIRWCYSQFKNDLFSVHPYVSKVVNIGFNSSKATNTKEKFNRYRTKLDDGVKDNFRFSKEYYLDPKIIRQFSQPYSIISRIIYKAINLLFKN
ncbi:glycosyltransferase [Flavobacterium alvei]|uniref:glycosyltransferase n=1 Tax=Flavobacterium alvei TaxID=2080416 RepID=UPI0026EC7F0F|nr:glycosyltransferase [Flavobacterium alvei]